MADQFGGSLENDGPPAAKRVKTTPSVASSDGGGKYFLYFRLGDAAAVRFRQLDDFT